MKPTIGRIVTYRAADHEAHSYGAPHATSANHLGTNGTREHPAMIRRVWSDTCVNLRVFFDAHPTEVRCSVQQLPQLPEGVKDVSGNGGWRWPDRA